MLPEPAAEAAVQRCSRCVYDATIPRISFDAGGVCNYCHQIDELEQQYPTGAEGQRRLEAMAEEMRRAGRGKRYDCVLGVSGGCDSSYLMYVLREQLHLRVLAAHYDNTWNSAIATQNINAMLRGLGVDLYTLVVDNEESDAIFRSFLEAGIAEVDLPTDIALVVTTYRAAAKHRVKHIVEGHSFRTEGMSPLGLSYVDGKLIASVYERYGSGKMKTFPNLWLHTFFYNMLFASARRVRPLYYMDYDKEAAKKLLTERFGWTWYGGHHLENRFTAFGHSYVNPRRGFDQRVVGYSALVRSGQMTREQALDLMARPPHIEDELVAYVKKRLGYSDAEFERLMNLPRQTYKDFPTYKPVFERLRPFFWLMWKLKRVPHSFYLKYTSKTAG